MMERAPDLTESIRCFNRFYTQRLGALNEGLLDSPLSLAHARVLWELAQGDGLSAVDLCRKLDLDPSYLSRIIGEFTERGWVTRTLDPLDARKQRIALTREGRATFEPLNEASRRQLMAWLKPLDAPDQARLVAAMGTVMRLLGAPGAAPPLIVFRSHRPGDLGWVIERQARLYAEEYGWDQAFEALVAEVCARFLRHWDPLREHCWIAEADGHRVGSVTLVAKSKTVAQLRMLFVAREARGLGIGSKLTEACLAFARGAGYRRIILWTNDCLLSARKIYQAAGFQLTRSEPHHSFGKDLVGQVLGAGTMTGMAPNGAERSLGMVANARGDSREPVIGIVGDRNPDNRTHLATEQAFGHLLQPIRCAWIATDQISPERLSAYAGLLIAPGSPYRAMEGALAAIRHAREARLPVLGTCMAINEDIRPRFELLGMHLDERAKRLWASAEAMVRGQSRVCAPWERSRHTADTTSPGTRLG